MTMRQPISRPPRLASALLAFVADQKERSFLIGDLAEEFHDVGLDRGWRAASRWYWSQTLRSTAPLIVARLTSEQTTRSVGATIVGFVTAIASATIFGAILNAILGFRSDATLGTIAMVVTACALVSSTCAGWASTWASGGLRRRTMMLIGLVVVVPDIVYAVRSPGAHELPWTLLPLSLAIIATCAGLAFGGRSEIVDQEFKLLIARPFVPPFAARQIVERRLGRDHGTWRRRLDHLRMANSKVSGSFLEKMPCNGMCCRVFS
jgi:hypothetical protein